MSSELPVNAEKLREDYGDVWAAFTALSSACHEAGPLDEKTRWLVKLALGAGLEGATHSATRNALDSGLTLEELKHVAISPLPSSDSRRACGDSPGCKIIWTPRENRSR